MNETREQWIEREARAARERCGYDDWDSRNELTRDVWRNVVAPYYQEPVADADTLEKLAKVAWAEFDTSDVIGVWPRVVAAVLSAAKPETMLHPSDFRKAYYVGEWESLKTKVNDSIRYRFELPQPETLRVPVDVDGLARVIHEAECAAHGDPDIAAARAALTYLNIEPCAKPEYDPDDVALTPNERNELVNLRAEVKRLRQWQVRVQQAINLPEVPK